jgi:hypothetical protein
VISAPEPPPGRAVDKLKADLAARLALQGHALLEMADGTYLVHRWNLSRPCANLQAVAEFARRIGALA